MNETMNLLFERKSMRVYTEREITEEEKEMLLRAACEAPTAGNQQLYTIIDVTDQKLKEALVETCDNQPFIAKAKLVLIFCADCKKWYDAYLDTGCKPRKPGVGDLMLAVADAVIAAQSAVVAAESLGIGSCYIGDVIENCERQRELLHLPEYVFPAAMVVFGFPNDQQLERPKPVRSYADQIVFENAYPEMTAEFRRELFEHKGPEGRPYEEWMGAFCRRKYNSDFSVEMTRSVGEYLRQYKS